MNYKSFVLAKIIQFVKAESPEISKLFSSHGLRCRLSKHMDYNTIVVLWDESEIAGVCIFNINGEVCDVHHAIVGRKYRYRDVLKQIVRQGYLRYPFVKKIEFRRELKYKDKKLVSIPIERFL